MRRDPTLSLARQLVIAPVLASEWAYEAKEDAPEGAADFIQDCLDTFRLHILRNAFLGWIDFGWAPFEKVFGFDDQSGKIKLKKLKPLLQDITSILIEPAHGSFAGFEQDDNVRLTVDGCLLLSCDVEGTDWYGNAIMRNAESAYDAWKDVEAGACRYDNRIAGSHWIVYYPVGKTQQENGEYVDNYTLAKRILADLEASGRMAIPIDKATEVLEALEGNGASEHAGWRIEILSDKGASQTGFVDRMKYLDTLKVRALGVPERSILEGQFGTKAEAGAHADFAILNMELRHQQAVEAVNWHLVNQLLRINYGRSAENTVFVSPAPIADRAISFLRTLYEKLISSPEGFANEILAIDTDALKDRLGIPIDEEAEFEEPEVPVEETEITEPVEQPPEPEVV